MNLLGWTWAKEKQMYVDTNYSLIHFSCFRVIFLRCVIFFFFIQSFCLDSKTFVFFFFLYLSFTIRVRLFPSSISSYCFGTGCRTTGDIFTIWIGLVLMKEKQKHNQSHTGLCLPTLHSDYNGFWIETIFILHLINVIRWIRVEHFKCVHRIWILIRTLTIPADGKNTDIQSTFGWKKKS